MIDQAPWEGTPGQSPASGTGKPYDATDDAEEILRTVLCRRNFGVDVRDRLVSFLGQLVFVGVQANTGYLYPTYDDAVYVQERILVKRMYSVDQTRELTKAMEKIVDREMRKRGMRVGHAQI